MNWKVQRFIRICNAIGAALCAMALGLYNFYLFRSGIWAIWISFTSSYFLLSMANFIYFDLFHGDR